MKLYGKRIIKKTRERSIDYKKETRDGIIWSVDTTNRKVTVKIQGSNNQITAWFPANWHSPPPWCKYGNPIKIMHTSGHRGRIEIVGNGLIIPNPVTGDLWPADPLAENRILEGLQVLAMPNVPGNKVMVTVGTARIEGVLVEVGPIAMDDGDIWQLGDGGWIGQVAAVLDANGLVDVEEFPEWGYRIHSVQLNQAGVISLIPGEQFEAYNNGLFVMFDEEPPPEGTSLDNLPKPSVPFGSIELATILRYENQTIIQNFDINYDLIQTLPWFRYGRQPTRLSVGLEMSVMEWTDSTCDIDVTCYDNLEQYMFFKYIELQASIIQGNGQLKDRIYDLPWGTTITAYQLTDKVAGIWYPKWGLQYKRDQLATDESPLIELRLVINTELLTYTAITLLDASGDPM